MNNTPLFMNSQSHFMTPGSVSFIPGWIMLLISIITIALIKPGLFKSKQSGIISPFLLAFIIGSLVPAFDDVFAFIFGPPFAHHSLFHSFIGIFTTFIIFRTITTKKIAIYAAAGNISHVVFNFWLDWTTLFFPITYREFGLTHIIGINTYWIKAIHYPIILLLFFIFIYRFFTKLKKK